jgi:hypothetical protein
MVLGPGGGPACWPRRREVCAAFPVLLGSLDFWEKKIRLEFGLVGFSLVNLDASCLKILLTLCFKGVYLVHNFER